MANESLFPQRWNDLPDPRPTAGASATAVIEVGEREWRKIVQKHFANPKEPWSEIFTSVSWPWDSPEMIQAVTTALVAVREECLSTLRKPMVLLYSCVGRQIRGQGHRWLLVLPCGALTVVWAENMTNRLKTCYFTGATDVKPKGKRWRHALRQQVQEYATFDEHAGIYHYPAADDRREVSVVGATSELRYDIQFNAAETWGFASNEPGAQWNWPNWNWENQEIRLSR